MLEFPFNLVFGKGTPCKPVDFIGAPYENNSPLPDCFIGIEVEVENICNPIRNKEALNIWDITEDGSLRNWGREFISLPIPAKYARFALDRLMEALEEENEPQFTSRTGIHIHVNVQDMNINQLVSFVLLYYVTERLLYRFVGRERKNNIFCVPLQNTNYFLHIYNAVKINNKELTEVIIDDLHAFKSIIEEWKKYLGLNLLPILRYGTVEFRHLYGTRDVDLIVNWINIILSLKKAAMEVTNFENLVTTLVNLNVKSEYHNFLGRIFGNLLPLLATKGFEKEFSCSISNVKDCVTPPNSIVDFTKYCEENNNNLVISFAEFHRRAIKRRKKEEDNGDV
jgi:hypothetical protein